MARPKEPMVGDQRHFLNVDWNIRDDEPTPNDKLARAQRGVYRFMDHPSGPWSWGAVEQLCDDFLVACEGLRHCKDFMDRDLDEDGLEALKQLLATPRQQALADFANISKHGNAKPEKAVTTGPMRLHLPGSDYPKTSPMSEIYRRLLIQVPSMDSTHPAEFLLDCLADWSKFYREHQFPIALDRLVAENPTPEMREAVANIKKHGHP